MLPINRRIFAALATVASLGLGALAGRSLAQIPGRAEPSLRIVPSSGKGKVHLLAATLETTQWGWFNNAQPPVLRMRSGDSVALETMMHSHNHVVPGTTI